MTITMRHVTTLVAAAVGSVALAGCGGAGVAASSSGSGALSNAQFVSQVNGICSQLNSRVVRLPAIHTTADLLATGAREMTVSTTALTHLAAVDAPAGRRRELARYVAGIRHEATLAGRLLVDVRHGDVTQLRTLAARETALSAADDTQAKAMGLAQCARDVQPGG